jgi:hypothetical protein
MMTFRQLKAAAKKVGVVIEKDGPGAYDDVTFTLVAPAGMQFGELNSHFASWEEYPRQDKEEGIVRDYEEFTGDLGTLVDCPDDCDCKLEND